MKQNILVAFVFLIVIASLTSVIALDSLGSFEINKDIRISQVCSDATYINISSISYPDSTIASSDIPMLTSGNGEFYYNFTGATQLGRYDVRGVSNGCEKTFATYFLVTSNGKDAPSGGLVSLFIILFLICLALTAYIMLYNIGHSIALDFDVIDVAFNFSIFFVIVALSGFERFYLGNPMMNTWLLWFMSIGGFILIFLPLLAFILSITIGSLTKKSPNFNGGVPSKIQFRRQR